MQEIGHFDTIHDFAAVPESHRAELSERLMRRAERDALYGEPADEFAATMTHSQNFVDLLWDDGYLSPAEYQTLNVALAEAFFDSHFARYSTELSAILEYRMSEI